MEKEPTGPREESRSLLEIRNLTTSFFTDGGELRAVDQVSLSIEKGEIFGLVGESGSGKTMTALSVLDLVPPPGRIVSGTITFEGRDLVGLSRQAMEQVRGNRIGMIFQEPMTSLNPVLRIGEQIREGLFFHRGMRGADLDNRVLDLLASVGLDNPGQRVMQYPHQLSGGQRQRVLVAMAIACEPVLVMADEPTTALDVATEAQIMLLLEDRVVGQGTALLFITHNLNLVRRMGRRVGLMYAGRILEINTAREFFREPLHPYGKGLVASIEGLKGKEARLRAIPGSVPKLAALPEGCKFHPRCPYVMPRCREAEPAMVQGADFQWVRCFLYQN
jgi:peptide/nickel transport system ATP-binding protein